MKSDLQLTNCQIFTPTDTVRGMLDLIEYNTDIYGKKIIDNSCGSGNFLTEIVSRFIRDGLEQNYTLSQIKEQLSKSIVGCELDKKYQLQCIANLEKIANEYGIFNVKWNVRNCDGLYVQEDEKYDYVVGNPPYIAYVDLDEQTRKLTKTNFDSCKLGKFDYSYAFIEKGLKLLNATGKMVFITPANMFKTVSGGKLREIIKNKITQIIDCSKKKIFSNALTVPTITTYDNSLNSDIIIFSDWQENKWVKKIIHKSSLIDKWNFTDIHIEGDRRFGDVFKVANSVATLANSIFIHTKNAQGVLDINVEEAILRTTKSPRSEQYHLDQSIIFPYYYDRGELRRYSEKQFSETFPLAYEFLLSNKQKLKSRDSDKGANWYEFGRSQALQHINQDKLLISSIITNKVVVYKMRRAEIPYSGIYIVPKTENVSLDTAKVILESDIFYRYIINKGIRVNGDSVRISSKDIENFKF